MRKLLLFSLCAMVFSAGAMQAQIGHNCPGEHPDLLRDKSGQLHWFTPERLAQMATKKVQPVTPQVPIGLHYNGDVTLKILVNKQGEVDCIWDNAGNPIFLAAADEAGRWWKFKPMVVDGKPMEFAGVLRFHFVVARH
jgi:hypothetical protein